MLNIVNLSISGLSNRLGVMVEHLIAQYYRITGSISVNIRGNIQFIHASNP